MNLNKCPQCQNTINESTNRLIQDACGHQKCRICLLKDETKCETCRMVNSTVNSTKYNVNKIGTEPKETEKPENIKSNTNILKSVSALDHILVMSSMYYNFFFIMSFVNNIFLVNFRISSFI